MPLPFKAYTNTVVYGDKGKANRDKLSRMMDGLENSLDNLSYDLKKRFKKLVVSQLSLLRYRDKDFDVKYLNINSNEGTKRAKNDSLEPMYTKTDKNRFDVMQRRKMNDAILRNNNLLKCNYEVGVDEEKVSDKFKEAVKEMKKINHAPSTYDKTYLHRDSGSKYMTSNSINSSKDDGKLRASKGRYSSVTGFDRHQDFSSAATNATDTKTNRQQSSFGQSCDINKDYHRHVINCNLRDNDHAKRKHRFSAETHDGIRTRAIPETLECELKERSNQVSNEPLHIKSEGMTDEKIDVDTEKFDIKNKTNYVKNVTNMADIKRPSYGTHLRKEKIEDIQLSGLSVEEYLRLMINDLNNDDLITDMRNRTRVPTYGQIQREKLDDVQEQSNPVKTYMKLIKNDMYDDGCHKEEINNRYTCQETNSKDDTTSRRLCHNDNEFENNYMPLQYLKLETSRQSEKFAEEKERASPAGKPDPEIPCIANQNITTNPLRRGAKRESDKIANMEGIENLSRIQRDFPGIAKIKDDTTAKQNMVQQSQVDQPTHPDDTMHKANLKNTLQLGRITDNNHNIVDGQCVTQPYQDKIGNFQITQKDKLREADDMANTACLNQTNKEQKVLNSNDILYFTNPKNGSLMETKYADEKEMESTKSSTGLGAYNNIDFKENSYSRSERIGATLTGTSKLPMRHHLTPRTPSLKSNEQNDSLTGNTKIPQKPVSSRQEHVDGSICTNMPFASMYRSRSPYMSLNQVKTSDKAKDEKIDISIFACTDAQKRADMTVDDEKEDLRQEIIQDNLLSESTNPIIERLEDDFSYHTFNTIYSYQSRNDHLQCNNYRLNTSNQPSIASDETNETTIVDSNDYTADADKLERWRQGINSMSTPQKAYPISGKKEIETINLVCDASGKVRQNLSFEKSNYQHIDKVKSSYFPKQHTDNDLLIRLGTGENTTDVTDTNLQTFDSTSSNKPYFNKGILVQSPLNDENTSVPRDGTYVRNLTEKQNPDAYGIRYTAKSKQTSPVSFEGHDTIRESFENNVPLKSRFKADLDQPLISNNYMTSNLTSNEKQSADMKIITNNDSANDKRGDSLMKEATVNSIAELDHGQHVLAQLNEAQKQLDQSIYNTYSDKSTVEIILSPRIRKMKRILCNDKENTSLEIIDNIEILNSNDDSKKDNEHTLSDRLNDHFKQSKKLLENSTYTHRSSSDKQRGGNQELKKQKGEKQIRNSSRSDCTGTPPKEFESDYELKVMSQLHQTNEILFLMENLMTENLQERERIELWSEVQTEMISMTKEISKTLKQKSSYRKQWDSKLRQAEKDLKKMIDSKECIAVEDTITRLKLAATKLGVLDRYQGHLFDQRDMLLRLHSLSKLLQALSHRTLPTIETGDTQTQDRTKTKPVFHPIYALYTMTGAATWPIRKLRNLARGTKQESTAECASSMISTDTSIPSTSYRGNDTNAANENNKSISSTSYEGTQTNSGNDNIKTVRHVDTDAENLSAHGTKSENISMAESVFKKERSKQFRNSKIGEDTIRQENSRATVAIVEDEEGEDITNAYVTFTNRISASIGHTNSTSVRHKARHPEQQLHDCSQHIPQSSRLFLCPEHYIIVAFIFGFILGAMFIIFGSDFLSFLERMWLILASYIICNCKLEHAASPIV